MAWRVSAAALVLAVLMVFGGCGGGGDEGGNAGGNQAGAAVGSVTTDGGSPEDYTLMLDGQEVDVDIQPDGSFQLPGIPPGDHVIDVVGPDGMEGGRVEFTIDEDETVTLPPIRPEAAGQIAGLVMLRETDGSLTPAEGISVIARSDLIWIMDGTDGPRLADPNSGVTASQEDDGTDARPLIYPPPPGATYDAVTDAAGSYSMKGVAPGNYLVTVAAAGYLAREVYVYVAPGRTAVADFTLVVDQEPEYGVIAGQVIGVGEPNVDGVYPVQANTVKKPLEGATVEVYLEDPWIDPPYMGGIEVQPDVTLPGAAGGSTGDADGDIGEVEPPIIICPPFRWDVLSTRTDADGNYELKVPVGRRAVQVWAWGYESGWQEVTVTAGGTVRADFELPAWVFDPPVPEPGPDAPLTR